MISTFQLTPPRRGRLGLVVYGIRRLVFQLTPPTQGAAACPRWLAPTYLCFNSRPHAGGGVLIG